MEITLLLSSAGRRVGLLECFRESARTLGIGLRVAATDLRPELSPACKLADRSYGVPECRDERFVDSLLKVCEREQARLLVPTIDPELEPLSLRRADFSAIGCDAVVSGRAAVEIARDKLRTSAALVDAGVSAPKAIPAKLYAEAPDILGWPVIIKPRAGSSSIGICRPENKEDAVAMARGAGDLIVQERWEGREYTVNLFIDRKGALRCAVPHLRIETRAGEVSKGKTEAVAVLDEAARKIVAGLPTLRGPICFQAIVNERNEYAVFEINPRFGGGYPLTHAAGGRFTQWMLEEALGLPLSAGGGWKTGLTMLRYDAAIFLNG